MTETMPPATKFTPLQLELLNMFGRNVPEEDLINIKDLIGKYYFDKLQKKVDAAVEKAGYTQDDFDAWLNDPNQ